MERQGKYHARNASRNRARGVALLLALALGLGGCSLTVPIGSLQQEEELTTSSAKQISSLSTQLDEEDWRRAQAALSLAVDPQGSGQPVNWDNPGSKRRGAFTQAGQLQLTDTTVCRPFIAMLQDTVRGESRHEGLACRAGPGEWAIREVKPLGATAAIGRRGDGDAGAQPLPPKSAPMLLTGERR